MRKPDRGPSGEQALNADQWLTPVLDPHPKIRRQGRGSSKDPRKAKKEQEERTKTKRQNTPFSANVNGNLSDPSPKENSSYYESPLVSPSKPGPPSPSNCSCTIQPQQVQTAYRAHLKASVPRRLNLSRLKCSSPGSRQEGIRYKALSPGGFSYACGRSW